MPHINNLSPAQIERLALLAEECSEVIHVVNKIIRHGYNSYHPDTPNQNNIYLLEKELGDLQYAIKLMVKEKDIEDKYIAEAMFHKQKTIGQYLHYNKP